VFFIIQIALFIFVIWWMYTLVQELRRMRHAIEPMAYPEEDQDDCVDDIEQLRRVGQLRAEGVISDEEFQQIKRGFFARDDD
jgi:CBS domain containing-hemolysin-like protein